MSKLQNLFLFKLILVIISFLGLSWINFSLAQPVSAAGKSAEEIYIQPIEGLDIGFFGISPKKIIEAIVLDNYQVYCANPTVMIHPEILGDYERYLELGFPEYDYYNEYEMDLNKLGIKVVDISNPLTVDDSGEPFKIDQVTFQGNHEVPMSALQVDPFQDNVITADYYKRLSLSEQCNYAKISQEQIDYLCDKKDVPKSQCALNIQIPNTGIKTLEITIPDCETLEKPEVIQSLDKETLIAIANFPLPHINGKRIAFLMRCVRQRPSFGKRLFDEAKRFLSSFIKIHYGDECHVLAIVIDSPTTEQETKNDPIEFQHLSRQTLTTLADWLEEGEQYKGEKLERLEGALAANARGYSDKERINCINCDKGDDREIKDALASYINSINPDCGGIIYEESETISSQASLTDGGGNYKATGDDAFKSFAGGGILSALKSGFNAVFRMGGNITRREIVGREARVETFIIVPRDNQVGLNQFVNTEKTLAFFKKKVEEEWPTHVRFNETKNKEAQDIGRTTISDGESFYDPERCEVDKYGNGIRCLNWAIRIKNFTEKPGDVPADQFRSFNQTQASLNSFGTLPHNHTIDTLYITPDTEKFLKGSGVGESGGKEESCSELKNITIDLPTMDELRKMVCSIAGGNADDAQLLWGLLQIEGSPFLRKIVAGESQMSCGEIIINSCGASQIMGVLIPQCIDKEKCPQAAYIAEDTSDPWIQEIRQNPNIACDARTSMEFILRLRKAEIGWLKEQYQKANGSSPSNQQLYYMMAGRNYGLPVETLVQPACQGAPAVQGCSGANYCKCAMDTFSFPGCN